MIIQTIQTSDCTPQTITIGRRGSYDTEQITFDLSYLIETYGDGVAVLMVKRPNDTDAYQAVTTQTGATLAWTISATDTSYQGLGECEIYWYTGDGLAKTVIFPLYIMRDIVGATEDPPDPYQTWVDHLTELGAETLENAQDAAESAQEAGKAALMLQNVSAEAETLEPESEATASYNDGVFTFGIPRGKPGSGGGAVESVNGKTGAVDLNAGDIEFDDTETYAAGSIGAEVSAQKNAICQKAPVIINTASGDIDSFADGADGMQIRKIVGTIVTPEGGSGWAGCEIGRCVSLLNGFTPDYRVGWAVSADSGDMNPYGGIGTACADYIDVSNYLGKQVYLNHRPTGNVGGFAFYSAKNISSYITGIGNRGVTTQGEWIITIPDNPSIKYMRFTANTNYLDKVILCLVETKTTLSINWQSEAGTILNGTVTLNEDRSADIVNSDTEDTYHLADVGSLSTFYGYNNIWIDTGSITECDYPADTKLYIDGLTAPDEDMIANANIASGKYFVVNNQLYLSTAAIAAGASIVPGTNCTATNLAEALNALNT